MHKAKMLSVVICLALFATQALAFEPSRFFPFRRSTKTLEYAAPESVGMSSERLEMAFKVIKDAIANGAFPGAVALVVRNGTIVGHRAFGHSMLTPQARMMQIDTIFDLASQTKPLVTATSIMILLERGKLRLDDKVTVFIPEFSKNGKEGITVRKLLTHTSGLPAWIPFYKECRSHECVIAAICDIDLEHEPGTKYVYSDLGYITLGEIVRRVSGKELSTFAEENIFKPLGMLNTTFNPSKELKERCAATEQCEWRGRVLVGEVHDENAFAMGGVSGHAGLFSTAYDLAIFAQMMLNGGEYNGIRIMSPLTVKAMTRNQIPELGEESLGWFTKSKEYSSGGDLISTDSYGHTGFTGTSMWIDPDEDLTIILLTNRVHPSRNNRGHIRVRPLFANAVAASIVESI
jgi:Beta-lactamase class C and other penicillin binding proteins